MRKTVKQLMDLKGRSALITGGAGHVGEAMAEALAEAGANVVLLDVDAKICEKKAKALSKKFKTKCFSLSVDLTKEEQIRQVPEFMKKRLGGLHILIHCAALVGAHNLEGWAVPFKKQKVDVWQRCLDINLTAPFILTQACSDLLMKSGKGTVINIGSIYGIVGPHMSLYKGARMGNPVAYGASKGGLLQLTRYLATMLAPKVRVNMISIGGIYRNHRNPFLKRYVEKTPLGRMATEEDLKGAALYLASDLSQYVAGHNLVVDGGWTTW